MEYEEATQLTQNTQGVVDPRRMGRNNSGLSEADISDVMCILHPCSPAAFRIVAETADRAPHHVLQSTGFEDFDDGFTQSALEEQETFIISSDGPHQPMDLALRFSARTKNAKMGFVFGRNPQSCDIVLATDTYKRVSNVHFGIFINDSGVLMLQDMSTNGTMVDDVVLKGKTAAGLQTRMLNAGSIIQILSPKPDEVVKFIVRIPSREGHFKEYEAKFQVWMQNVAAAEAKAKENTIVTRRMAAANPRTQNGVSIKAPLVQNQYGMHWSGGDRYNVVGLIGKGAFATVYQLATKSEGQLYAAKELEKRKFMKNGILDRKLDNEMNIMKAVSHENIVKYVDYVDHLNHMYIIMEFVPCGDLAYFLALHGPLQEPMAKKMAAQVLDALSYLHKKMITHRDIKPDNILLANLDSDHFSIKLSDFGLSKVVKDNETFLKTFCGTLLYCAPEVFPHYDKHVTSKGKKRPRGSNTLPAKFHSYSQSVDIWSFGAVLWYSLCIRPPFEGVADNTGRGMFDKIMMTPLDATDLVKQGVSDDAVALLVEMLNTDPAARPSPAYCLRHKWFGLYQPSDVDAQSGPENKGLVAIAEEEEAEVEDEDEPDMSGLSLDEQESGYNSQTSEVSIHSGSMEFLDPRQSKRFKSDVHAYRDQDDLVESSPELFYQSIRIMHQPEAGQASAAQTQPGKRKLFGEISQYAFDSAAGSERRASSEILGPEAHDDVPQADRGASVSGERVPSVEVPGAVASPSLLGAESMVRELHMHSPHSSASQDENYRPVTPRTAGAFRYNSTARKDETNNAYDDITPKQPQRPLFDRQINIPIPASFYYEATDPTTHTLEYASKMSGRNYVQPNSQEVSAEQISLPATASGSGTDIEDEGDLDEGVAVGAEQASPQPPPSQFIKPPPRLGKLVSTSDSFANMTINLSERMSTWGRLPSNTHPHPEKYDTRVPKRGIIVIFHARDIDKSSQDGQSWMKLPDLYCVIATDSSQGLYINGVLLKKGEPGKMNFGHVYTGDEVVVLQKGQDGKLGLTFTCEFFHGEAKQQRPENIPRFEVKTEGSKSRPKGKEKEKVASPEQVAVA